ncbi:MULTISPECIES: hypothetical protein [unclassified Streptomyces]|uniref:hypothetical protein n=1 Tax=unclassified Streptomyces TaxID=2593676 RepID=UPI0006FF5777|nr:MULTISPECIES: hypothetical protein [unclassified Streptomyces]KQX45606.1 hypothetical protein ASD33_24545 [Streptomyces sp. Root1304]KRA79550.1 hypothetical protein ASE09_20065 [Streptomyces sp. Root66D1]
MPQNEGPQHEGFEEELGAVLRGTGDIFAADDRRELAEGGIRRGRRRLVRRRLAVTGGVLALAAVGIGGVYGGSLLGPAASPDKASVAAPPQPSSAHGSADSPKRPGGTAEIPVKDIAAVLKAHSPQGTWDFGDLNGSGQAVAGVFDDGNGKAAVSVGLYRASGSGEAGEGRVACPDEVAVPFDDCTTQNLPNGSRLMILQGYEYPDKREETKSWRAVLLTKDGFLIDASEYNAAAEKGAPISRPNPPLTPAQLKSLVTTDAWGPLLAQLPTLPKKPGGNGRPEQHPEPTGTAVRDTLRSLLPQGLTVRSKGGEDSHGYVVVDDGKGASLVGVDVQPGSRALIADLFGGGDVVTLPDGRMVRATQQPGEKGGAGVVWWNVDTITPDGFRVVVSGFNSPAQHEAATRAEPALTMEQLKTIALSQRWHTLPMTNGPRRP